MACNIWVSLAEVWPETRFKSGLKFEKFFDDYLTIVNCSDESIVSSFPSQDKVKVIVKDDTHFFINHYPDFIVKTKSGKIILIETKGEHLKNDDSQEKLKLADDWISHAGDEYNYFMVFDKEAIDDRNACTVKNFIQTVSEL